MKYSKIDAQEFISLLFLSRDYAHNAHLNTDSFSQHSSLGSFYSEVIDLADSFAETWMGRSQEKIGDIALFPMPKGEPLNVLKDHLSIIQKERSFAENDTVLSNIIDEIEALYSSTLYKLKFLK
jgi:hypothetical protein